MQFYKNIICSSFGRHWYIKVSTNNPRYNSKGNDKLRIYQLFKTNMGYEPYLNINNIDRGKFTTQFRISASKL